MSNLAPAFQTRKEDILTGLNEDQQQAVINYEGASFIIAAPGSGKTKTIVRRAAYMIEDGIDPASIIMFTFTNKAAQDMKDKVHEFIGARSRLMTVGTYHSICGRLLRSYCSFVGLKPNFTIYDEEEKAKVLKKFIPSGINVKTVIGRISKYKEKMLSPSAAMQKAKNEFDVAICNVYSAYQEQIRSCNAMDFDDMIYYMIRIMEENDVVRKAINDKYRYVFADEFQDSSPKDIRLIELLAGERLNLCMVADDEQSIYGFRGAELQAVFALEERIQPTFHTLGCNYRSTGIIIAAARSLIEHNEGQYQKEVYTVNPEGYPPMVYECYDQNQESTQVARIIKAMHKKGVLYNNMAVLYRTSFLSRDIERCLMKNSVPYVLRGGVAFYARKEVKDVLAYLRLLFNPSDMQALARIWNVPKRNIGDKTAAVLSDIYAKTLHETPKDAIIKVSEVFNGLIENAGKLRANTKKGLEQLAAVMGQLQGLVDIKTPPCELLKEVILLTNYEQYLRELDDDAIERIGNLDELMRVADSYVDLEEFLYNSILHTEVTEEENEIPKAVQLMTMHSSKGLEFEVVIIVGANNGTTPHHLMMETQTSIEEERRLFYVAMTRAEKYLFITRPKISISRGMRTQHSRSMFLDEIDPTFLKVEKL